MIRQRLAARLNLVLAAALTVEMQVEAALLPVDTEARALVHVLVAVLGLAFALRSRLPLASLVAAQVVFVVAQADRAVPEQLYVPLFLILFLNLSAAMHVDGRRFWVVPAITFLGGSISILTDDYPGGGAEDLVWLAVIYTGLTAAIGRLLGNRVALQSALRAKADRVEAERREARER
nr:hypothetical protein [Solirubrobacterales bacterium]